MTDYPYLLYSFKHGAWLSPDERGYTATIDEAGRYPLGRALDAVTRSSAAGRVDQSSTLIVAPEAWGEYAEVHKRRAAPTQGVPVLLDFGESAHLAIRCVYCGSVLLWQTALDHDRPLTAQRLAEHTRAHDARCRRTVDTPGKAARHVHPVR